MRDGASDQGPSEPLTMSPQNVLLHCNPARMQRRSADASDERTCVMLENRYFSVDHVELWKPTLLQSLGETCHRATHVNGFHVLLCNRRVVLVGSGARHLTFPPFEDVVSDAYVETIADHRLLVIAAVSGGVHVAVVGVPDEGRAATVESTYCTTTAPVARIHHLKKGLYGLCCDTGSVETLSVRVRGLETPEPQLEASVLAPRRGWKQTAFAYVSRTRYVCSFFDHDRGHLFVLTGAALSLWMYRDEQHLHLEASMKPPASNGVALVAAPPHEGEGEDGQVPDAVLITDDGVRVPVHVGADASRPSTPPRLALGEVRRLPSGVTNVAVTLAVSCGSTFLFADQTTTSVVLSTQCEPFHGAAGRVVSQLFVGKKICGVGVERRRGAGGEFVNFLVYCGDSTIVRVGRVPRGQLLVRLFAVSAHNGAAALRLLDPVTRVDVLLDAALGGLPLQRVVENLSPLMFPEVMGSGAATLSDGAKGVLVHALRHLGELSRLCSAFWYWRRSEELTAARVRVEKCAGILTEVLNAGGWLDCPEHRSWRWSGDLVVELPEASDVGASALNAQAALLQLLLSSLHSACTIVWLFDMQLLSDQDRRFPGRLEDMLWVQDPAAVQDALCMELLALQRESITERLMGSERALPRRCRLAATLRSLVQGGTFDSVAAFVRRHILDLVQCDLLRYANDVVERHFPRAQSRLLFMVYHYPHHRGASAEIIAHLQRLDDPQQLYSALLTVLGDSACDGDLRGVLLDWMEGSSLADSRLLTFAKVVVEAKLSVDPAHTLAGRFFSSCVQEAAGHAQQAAVRFGELARSELSVPLSGRLLSVQHALQAMPSDVDRLTQFLLLLQEQLASLLERHLRSGKDFLYTRSAMEGDLVGLREHYLGETRLFELAGKYKSLGGSSIQLDLLKVHADAAPFAIANAVTGVLTFLAAVGLTATEAVRRVLHEYLDSFQAPLPLFPFVEFLAFDGLTPAAVMQELAAAGVQLPVLFDTFMTLLDGHGTPLFPVAETVTAVAQLVPKMDRTMQHICASHLLECSRSLLDGDQRGVALSEEEELVLREVGDEMQRLSQRVSAMA